jgi:hypothetical protein
MNHPEEAPDLPKFPFIVGDLALLGAAAFIAQRSENPITPREMLAITLCVVLGAALLVIPYLVNYARRQDALLSERQNQIAALARTTAESAEQISIAVAGIQTLVTSIPKAQTAPPAPAPIEDNLLRRLAELEALTKAQSAALAAHEKASVTPALVSEEVPLDDAIKTPKTPRPRKAKPADAALDLGLIATTPESLPSTPTTDGFTRLLATAYIGIGQKLYLRGEGPGLSWDKGVPLQFISIGKWQWENATVTAPITVKIYKNDQVECTGLGPLTLTPGHLLEVNAGF